MGSSNWTPRPSPIRAGGSQDVWQTPPHAPTSSPAIPKTMVLDQGSSSGVGLIKTNLEEVQRAQPFSAKSSTRAPFTSPAASPAQDKRSPKRVLEELTEQEDSLQQQQLRQRKWEAKKASIKREKFEEMCKALC